MLFAHEGITPGIRRAFVVYLVSSNRPVHEVLFPPLRNVQHDYEHKFGPNDYRPNLFVTYWSFRMMIGLMAVPALFTNMSNAPKLAFASLKRRSMSAAFETSHCTAIANPPLCND